MAPVGTATLGAATAVCGAAPWGFSAADAVAALEDGVANTQGIKRSRYEGSFSATPSRRFVRLMLLPIGGYFA